jgi:hypothetical protein
MPVCKLFQDPDVVIPYLVRGTVEKLAGGRNYARKYVAEYSSLRNVQQEYTMIANPRTTWK